MKIEVWSDFVCPFCYIGKRTLEMALEQFSHNENVIIEYKSYELAPDAEIYSKESYYELLASKLEVSTDQAKNMSDSISKQAAGVGLTYNFNTAQSTNTFDAHRIAKYASIHEKGSEMTERLLKAYFTDSEHIGDHPTLINLASEVGLDSIEVAALLKTRKYTLAVHEDQELAKQIGIQGVPFFVFNEKYALSGAQRLEAFTEVFEKVWEEECEKPISQSLNRKKSKTTYCTGEACDKDE